RDLSGNTVSGAVTYDPQTRTAILDPLGLLAQASLYTVTIKGGTSGPRVQDSLGNALATDFTWSFTTRGAAPNPIVAENLLPGNPASEWDIAGAGDDNIQGFATD